MGIWAWVILLAWSALIATATQYAFFRNDRKPTDYDWVYIAGGAVLRGFTAHVWHPGLGPVVDGLNLVQALAGGVVGGFVAELVYRLFIRRRRYRRSRSRRGSLSYAAI
jgi:cytochrome c biogenesis protein CcdA